MEVGRGQRQFDLSLLKSSKVNFVVGQDTFKIFKAKEIIQVSIYIGIKLRAIEHKCWDRDSFRAFFFISATWSSVPTQQTSLGSLNIPGSRGTKGDRRYTSILQS